MEKVTIQEARRKWDDALAGITHPIEYVSPEEALRRVLARDIYATQPFPPYRKSPFDGYAVHTDENVTDFSVITTIGAGEIYDGPVAAGEAVRLMTGCVVPQDCDTVIMQEHVQCSRSTIHITEHLHKGDNIIPMGEECQSGKIILKRGTFLDSGKISTAVGLGNTAFPVYKEIHILFLTSGRELVMPGESLGTGKIYNSNAVLFRSLFAEEGLKKISFYHVTDDPDRLEEEKKIVGHLAENADIIISTGGVSVGLFDTMPQIYESLGAHMLYNRIAMRPGSASYGGMILKKGANPTVITGLSGNPSASFNAYHLIAIPIIRCLRGERNIDFPVVTCRMNRGIHKKNPVDRYVQGVVSFKNGQPVFTPNMIITSSALLGLAHTNGLAMIKKGDRPCEDGDTVNVMLLKRI